MEEDIKQLTNEDLKLLYDTFSIVRTGHYQGSEFQLGFKNLFNEADTNGDGIVHKDDFYILIMGYLNSKHIKATKEEINA